MSTLRGALEALLDLASGLSGAACPWLGRAGITQGLHMRHRCVADLLYAHARVLFKWWHFRW